MKTIITILLLFGVGLLQSCGTSDGTSGGGGTVYTSLPLPPSNPVATATSSSTVKLTWSDNSNDETAFIIERKMLSNSYIQIATLSANTTMYNDASLIPNTTYTYKIASSNPVGTSNFSIETVVTTPP